jgi:four helix bundle protein
MKKDNVIREKSYDFSIKIINLYLDLKKQQKEYILSSQILRSATSIGANVEEAIGGQSLKDFFSKICIAYKEARETHYWLRLFRDTNIITQDKAKQLLNDLEEILKIITKIQTTTKQKVVISN